MKLKNLVLTELVGSVAIVFGFYSIRQIKDMLVFDNSDTLILKIYIIYAFIVLIVFIMIFAISRYFRDKDIED
jgi:hypothetical protein